MSDTAERKYTLPIPMDLDRNGTKIGATDIAWPMTVNGITVRSRAFDENGRPFWWDHRTLDPPLTIRGPD